MTTHHTPTWVVARPARDGDGPWEIRCDGQLVDIVAGHYDAWEVLLVAEQHVGPHALAWVLAPDIAGFRSVTAAEVAAL